MNKSPTKVSIRLFLLLVVFTFLAISGFAQNQEKPSASPLPEVIIYFEDPLEDQLPGSSPTALPGEKISSDISLVDARFGVLKKIGPGKMQFAVATSVPLITGQEYGWAIKVKTSLDKITWREELELPRMPLSWGGIPKDGGMKISDDNRISSMEREVSTKEDYIYNFWGIAFGDPKGVYKIRVYLNGTLAKEFSFTCAESD